MNTKEYVTIEGASKEKVVAAVQLMANLYSDVEYSKDIKIFELSGSTNTFIVNFSFRPDFQRFQYFVNYLYYPEVDDYKAKVRGYWTIDHNDGLPKHHSNQRAMLYVPDSDEEGDNVYVTFDKESQSYKLGFALGEGYTELNHIEIEFDEPAIHSANHSVIATVHPDPSMKREQSGKGCLLTVSILVIVSLCALLI